MEGKLTWSNMPIAFPISDADVGSHIAMVPTCHTDKRLAGACSGYYANNEMGTDTKTAWSHLWHDIEHVSTAAACRCITVTVASYSVMATLYASNDRYAYHERVS